MQLRFHEFQKGARGISQLISFGLLIHFILGGLAAHYIADLSWSISFLISSILVVTGPTVIIPALRQVKLAKRPASFLKWEGIINDPMGALLAILIFEYLIFKGPEHALTATFSSLAIALFGAIGASWLMGNILRLAFQRALVPNFLKVPMVFCHCSTLLYSHGLNSKWYRAFNHYLFWVFTWGIKIYRFQLN